MSQQYFSESEWAVLTQAPMQVIKALTLVDKTDPVSFLKEVKVGIQSLVREQQRQDISSDLVRSLVAALSETDAKESLQGEGLLLRREFELIEQLQTLKNSAEGRQIAIDHFKQVGSILAAKITSVQALEFKNWLMAIAHKVAEAVKEEGIFGIGGERISGQESSMIKQLEQALEFKA